MTKQETEQEISKHLNAATHMKRKQVLEDTIYILAMKQGDVSAALERAYGIIYGAARNMTEQRRMMKKKRKADRIEEFC